MSWWNTLGREIYKATPIDNIVQGVESARSGNWWDVGKQLGLGAVDTALLMVPGGAAVRGARVAGAGIGRSAALGAGRALGVPGASRLATRAGMSAVPPASKVGRFALGLSTGGVAGRALGATVLGGGIGMLGLGGQQPGLRPPFMTADMAERRAQAGAVGNRMGVEERRLSNLGAADGFVDTSAVTGVGGPTGDMMAEYEMYLRQAQEDYERQIADIAEGRARAEEDYRLGTRRSRRGTAGRSANLSALLAAMGMDLSPAASEGGLSYEAQRGGLELAGLERGRMQARTGATRGEADADAERKRRIAELNRYLMTGPAAAAGNAGVPRF